MGYFVCVTQVGEYQSTLDVGARWLQLNAAQPDAGDVAAAMALAYCDRASDRLQAPAPAPSTQPTQADGVAAGPGAADEARVSVLAACDDLEAALAMLHKFDIAQQLQSQIAGALRVSRPVRAPCRRCARVRSLCTSSSHQTRHERCPRRPALGTTRTRCSSHHADR